MDILVFWLVLVIRQFWLPLLLLVGLIAVVDWGQSLFGL